MPFPLKIVLHPKSTEWNSKKSLTIRIAAYHQKALDQFDQDFKPKGAIAFFVLLVILGLIIWYGIYFLMLKRA
jgi:hypothetical protein